MDEYLRRLLRTSAAYQASDLIAKLTALFTLPLYTRYVARDEYGAAEVLVTVVILTSIVIRFGVIEALVRRHFLGEDVAHQRVVARTASAFLFLVTTAVAIPAALLAGPLSELLLGRSEPGLLRITVLGLWAFTNIELALTLLRVAERIRAFLIASLLRVTITVATTATLVVGFDLEAQGLLLGTYGGTLVVLLGLWWALRDEVAFLPGAIDRAELGAEFRFGLPTVPAEVSLYAVNVVDRLYLFRVESPEAAGIYAVALKLGTAVTLFVRGFQYAWPPLAYSVEDDDDAARLYSRVTTYYVLATGIVVAGLALLGRWLVRLFAAPDYFEAHEALPWLGLGWALYGLVLVLVTVAGRAQITTRNAPAALIGLVANVVGLVTLVPALGVRGAGIALAFSYLVMLVVMQLLTRPLFPVSFEWARLATLVVVLAGVAVAGELLLPTDGLDGFLSRAAALASIPVLLAFGFLRPGERAWLRALARRERP